MRAKDGVAGVDLVGGKGIGYYGLTWDSQMFVDAVALTSTVRVANYEWLGIS